MRVESAPVDSDTTGTPEPQVHYETQGARMPEPTTHKPWPRPWTWAIALAVLLFGGHATVRWWGAALVRVLFGDIPTPADAPPLAWVLLAGWLILSFAGGQVLGSLRGEGSRVRDRRWAHEQAAREWQWALERKLREECLPDRQREAIRERRRREVRRRLGLPEEDEAHD